jgi:hypothetical protein
MISAVCALTGAGTDMSSARALTAARIAVAGVRPRRRTGLDMGSISFEGKDTGKDIT